jgi:hypothetical protein
MNRWMFLLLALTASVGAGACGSQSAAVTSPSSTASLTGTWVGSASDSSGSMMGSGMSGATAGATTWQVTQSGSVFSGTMRVGGSGSAMMVSGTMNGKTGSFTMNMPMGSMMSSGCTSTANGTFDMDDRMTQLHGTYTGTNSCRGAFDHGQISMLHQ